MKQLARILLTAVIFSRKSVSEGLLALEDKIEELEGNFLGIFKYGMKLALDGINAQLISKILSNMIENETSENEIRLKKIQREAVIGIHAGENTRYLLLKLFSYLYDNERCVLEKYFFKDDFKEDDINDIEDVCEEEEPADVTLPFEFVKRTACILKTAGGFAIKAKSEGLLSLEDELDDIDEEFLKQGLRFVIDATDSEIINVILSNKINIEKDENVKRYYSIQKEAVLNIQSGNNPELIMHKLISFIDNSELKEISVILQDMEFFKENNFDNFYSLEKEEKKFPVHAANIIHRAYKFSGKSNNGRISAVNEIIDQTKRTGRDIFEYGMQLLISGASSSAEDMSFILTNLVSLEKDEEIKRLKTIQKEAVLGICNNENPAMLFHLLLSFLNNEELEEIKKLFSTTKFANIFFELLYNPSSSQEDIDKKQKQYNEDLEDTIGSREVIGFFNKPYNLLKNTDENLLSELIKQEHPQTIASVLAWFSCGCFSAGGIETAAGILRLVERSQESKIISTLETEYPEFAEELKEYLFTFQDFILLDTEVIKKVINEVDSFELAKALKTLDAETQDKILKAMSIQAASRLKEDMEYMGHVRKIDIEEARRGIVQIVRNLEDNGEINIRNN